MAKRILIVNGHPDSSSERFCAALAQAYALGAKTAGHEVRTISIGDMDVPFLASKREFEGGQPSAVIRAAQVDFQWCEHLVIVFPLWLGAAPAKLKAFLEQVLRQGFAFEIAGSGWKPRLGGRSVRIILTMGMPATAFRLVFGAHGLLSLERGALMLTGLSPIRHSLLGMIEAASAARRGRWLAAMGRLGAKAK
jgi:putative NADPH-quinone reductase